MDFRTGKFVDFLENIKFFLWKIRLFLKERSRKKIKIFQIRREKDGQEVPQLRGHCHFRVHLPHQKERVFRKVFNRFFSEIMYFFQIFELETLRVSTGEFQLDDRLDLAL